MTNKQIKTWGQINPRCLWSNSNSPSRPKQDKPTKDATKKEKSKEEVPRRVPEKNWETCVKEVEKVSPPFNFENEMSKIIIFFPFNELIKKGEYRD
jgi:hypothetical protein